MAGKNRPTKLTNFYERLQSRKKIEYTWKEKEGKLFKFSIQRLLIA